MLNFFFIETKADTESTLDRTATKLFFRVVTTADYAFSLAMRKNYSFHRFDSCAGPPGICFFHAHSGRWKAKHNPLINCIHIQFWLHKCWASVAECRQEIFPHGGIQWYTFASHPLSRQMKIFQTTVQLLFAIWQIIMNYWQESTSSTFPYHQHTPLTLWT